MPNLDSPIVSARYFFPRRDALTDPVWVDVDGARLACGAHPTTAGRPTLLHFHGNGEVVADWIDELGPAFAQRGVNTFFAEYRGYGTSTGTPQLVAMLGDVCAIFEAAGCAADQTVIYGRSVGSIYAIHLAHVLAEAGTPPRGLVIESGISDPLSRILMRVRPDELGVSLADLEAEAAAHLDHEAKLRSYPGRTLVVHAAGDHLVAPEHARKNARWSGGELLLFERGDHNSIYHFNRDRLLAAVAEFATTA